VQISGDAETGHHRIMGHYKEAGPDTAFKLHRCARSKMVIYNPLGLVLLIVWFIGAGVVAIAIPGRARRWVGALSLFPDSNGGERPIIDIGTRIVGVVSVAIGLWVLWNVYSL